VATTTAPSGVKNKSLAPFACSNALPFYTHNSAISVVTPLSFILSSP